MDNDCDGLIDDQDPDLDESTGTLYYQDSDGDGYGELLEQIRACAQPAGYVENSDDCNDLSPYTNPDATECMDGVDNDCDGLGPWEDPDNLWWDQSHLADCCQNNPNTATMWCSTVSAAEQPFTPDWLPSHIVIKLKGHNALLARTIDTMTETIVMNYEQHRQQQFWNKKDQSVISLLS